VAQRRTNLQGVTSLVVDGDHYGRTLLSQMLRGFGAEPPVFASSGASAIERLKHNCFDLCVIEATLPDIDGIGVIRFIRRLESQVARFTPVIVLTGYTHPEKVAAARDAGANCVIKKPVSPRVLFDHIVWIGRNPRPFVEAGDYVGPDRRFKPKGPDARVARRETDLREMAANEFAASAAMGNDTV
jgi:CheY-like chemotaxis protein